jgi:hypothetical protein
LQGEFYGLPNRHHVIEGGHAEMIGGSTRFHRLRRRDEQIDLNNPIPLKMGKLARVFSPTPDPA